MDKLFHAISDQNRRKILEMLKERELTAGEIAAGFTITKPSITHHLNILYQSGLVEKERKGQYILYSLNTSVLQEILNWVLDFYRSKNQPCFRD
ncbi:MAG: autorepressor SdpR family transcription factor [Halanaerobiales bacterium]|nr:autorepressor SdpR family transcription factor [Halanaerobiales bacterium]